MREEEHDYKPVPKFFGKDDYYLGLELEVEAPTPEKKTDGLQIIKRPVFCYAKHDGSLARGRGWELVTHPTARKLWINSDKKASAVTRFLSLVKSLKEMGYTSHANTNCGLHIHVSLSAFVKSNPPIPDPSPDHADRILRSDGSVPERRKKNCPHLYWFCRVVNSVLFKKLSQRGDYQLNRWTKIQKVSTESFHNSGSDTRYVATNISDYTCEVRLFRGNMREDRIRKAVESVVAAVEYTRGFGSKQYVSCKEDKSFLMNEFICYARARQKEYPNLVAFLDEIGANVEVKACV